MKASGSGSRRKTAEKLPATPLDARSLIEASLDPMVAIGLDGKIADVNAATEQAIGFPRKRLIGSDFSDYFTEPGRAGSAYRRVLSEGVVKDHLLTIRHASGRTIDVLCNASVFKNEAGDVQGVLASARDITQRKRTAEELRALSSRQEAILASVPDVIMEVDADRVYTWANRAGFEFFGEDVIGKPAIHYFEGDQETYDAVRPLFEGSEDVIYLESWQRRKDGAKRLLAWWCRVLKDSRGEVTGALSAAQDITERRQVHEELLASEKRFRAISSNTPDHVLMQDRDLRYTLVINPQLGLTEEDMVGKTDHDLLSKEDADRLTEIKTRVLETGDPVRIETSLISTTGESEFFDGTYVPTFDAQGEVGGLIGYFRNITERKNEDEALRRRGEELETVLDILPVIVWVCLDPECRVITGNRAANELTRTAVGTNVSQSAAATNQGVYLKQLKEDGTEYQVHEQPMQRAIATADPVRDAEIRFCLPNDRQVDVFGQAAPLFDADGRVRGAVAAFVDVTERKAAEDELARHRDHLEELVSSRTKELAYTNAELDQLNDELQATNKGLIAATAAKDEFLASMSHELRTPLNSVIGFSGLLLSGAVGPLTDEVRKQIGMISSSGHHLLSLIDDLLDLDRVGSGGLALVPVMFDPRDVMKEVTESIRPLADEKNLELRSKGVAGMGSFFGDRRVVTQVLMNLCANAVKYTDAGSVAVHCRKWRQTGIEYEVTDTGRGIAHPDLKRMFGKFVQLDRHGEPLQSGTGLGLPLARGLAREHGGDVTVRSVLGEGSSFKARFAPCRSQDA